MSKDNALEQIDEMIASGIKMVRSIRSIQPVDSQIVDTLMEAFNANGMAFIPAVYHLGQLVLIRDDCRLSEDGPTCPGCDGQCACEDCEYEGGVE